MYFWTQHDSTEASKSISFLYDLQTKRKDKYQNISSKKRLFIKMWINCRQSEIWVSYTVRISPSHHHHRTDWLDNTLQKTTKTKKPTICVLDADAFSNSIRIRQSVWAFLRINNSCGPPVEVIRATRRKFTINFHFYQELPCSVQSVCKGYGVFVSQWIHLD